MASLPSRPAQPPSCLRTAVPRGSLEGPQVTAAGSGEFFEEQMAGLVICPDCWDSLKATAHQYLHSAPRRDKGLIWPPQSQCPPGTQWHPACLPLLGKEGWAGRSPWPPGMRAQGHASSDRTPWVTDAPTLGSLAVSRTGQQRWGRLHRTRLCICLCAPRWCPFGKTPSAHSSHLGGVWRPPTTLHPQDPSPVSWGPHSAPTPARLLVGSKPELVQIKL